MKSTCSLCRFRKHIPPYYAVYDRWASNFIPRGRIRNLFVAESPSYAGPDVAQRPYFYNVNYVGRGGYLLRGILGAIGTSDQNSITLKTPGQKEELLRKFQEMGCFLLDAARCPVNRIKDRKLRDEVIISCAETFLYDRIGKLADAKGIDRIFVVKSNVYSLLREKMLQHFAKEFVDVNLPFPSTGWQKVFKEKLRSAIEPPS